MKKEGMVVLFLAIFIISISFVSANWISNFLGTITISGRTTENVTEEVVPPVEPPPEEVPPEEEPVPPETPPETPPEENVTEPVPPETPPEEECVSAGGGTWAGDPNCCEGLKAVSDCLPDQQCPISARYCVNCGNGACDSYENWYNCAADCEKEPVPPGEAQCVSGEIRYHLCADGTKVPECFCETSMWVCKLSIKDDCPDTRPEPEICAARITVTFNKETYQVGDDVKVIIEVFDSQGNHLPYYSFYGQMYDNMWHSADLQQTDSQGYFIHTGTAEKPAGGVTQVTFKVYTKVTASCGSVEDTEEVKFQPEECGIGGCVDVDEPVCKDAVRMCGGECTPCPEEDEDREIFYACSGCELEDKCYPYGYRKTGRFCSDESDTFIEQSGDDEKCENNFECKTNLCINGECISGDLWNRILSWFRTMFGGGVEPEPGPEFKDCSELLIERNIGSAEYGKSTYGEYEHTRVVVYSENGENIGTIKCCMADYSTGASVVCPFDDKEDAQNTIKWLLAKGEVSSYILTEYKREKVINSNDNGMLIWTNENYIIASGGKPEAGDKFVEAIADVYFEKYPSNLGDIEIPKPRTCEEIEDITEQAGCYIDLAIKNSDFFICEKITYNPEHRDKCYINVAEHMGNSNICDKVADSSLREKCYLWVAEQGGSVDTCEGMTDSSLQAMCYVEIAEKTGDAGFCAKITDSHIGDKCYRDVGIQTNNRALCEEIIEAQAKQKCFDNTS